MFKNYVKFCASQICTGVIHSIRFQAGIDPSLWMVLLDFFEIFVDWNYCHVWMLEESVADRRVVPSTQTYIA